MRPFAYACAHDLGDAMQLLQEHPRAICIAGGTTVVDLLKEQAIDPDVLIDIRHAAHDEVRMQGNRIEIGALARMSRVADDPRIAFSFPAIAQALAASASPQLRNMATIGGNLLQRTRCVYFRDIATPCNKRSRGQGCSAIEGWNRQHAVLGTSEHCIAAHPSDLAVALIACDAAVDIAGPRGSRTIALDAFYRVPEDTPDIEHDLARDEIITGVTATLTRTAAHSVYLKVRDRASFEFALVSVAAGLEIRSGAIADARIVLGGVATKPWRARAAEQMLIGREPSDDLFLSAARAALAGARGYGGNTFKILLAQRAVVRALSRLCTGS